MAKGLPLLIQWQSNPSNIQSVAEQSKIEDLGEPHFVQSDSSKIFDGQVTPRIDTKGQEEKEVLSIEFLTRSKHLLSATR